MIVLLLVLYLYSLQKYESFTCNRDLYYVDKIFRPVRAKIINVKPADIDGKKVNKSDFILSLDKIKKGLAKIKIQKPKSTIYELQGSNYNYKKGYTSYIFNKTELENNIMNIFNKIKSPIQQEIITLNKGLCNNNICNLKLLDYKIKRLGKMNNVLVIEGQLIISIDKNSKYFVLDFVGDKSNIYMLKCTGLDNKEIYSYLKYASEVDKYEEQLNILGSPLYGKYDLPKTHIYSSLETYLKPNKSKKIPDKFPYFCFGSNAVNKIDCEKLTKNNTKGVWDKACESDNECPFYQYGSDNGKCRQGLCQFPIGVTRISPRKYINEEQAICKNCKTNTNLNAIGKCCIEQKDRKKYPNINGPQYIFEK